jgi:hypothetical protein
MCEYTKASRYQAEYLKLSFISREWVAILLPCILWTMFGGTRLLDGRRQLRGWHQISAVHIRRGNMIEQSENLYTQTIRKGLCNLRAEP